MKRIIYSNPVLKTVSCAPCRTIAQVSSIEGGSGENYGTSDGTWDGSNSGEGYGEKPGKW